MSVSLVPATAWSRTVWEIAGLRGRGWDAPPPGLPAGQPAPPGGRGPVARRGVPAPPAPRGLAVGHPPAGDALPPPLVLPPTGAHIINKYRTTFGRHFSVSFICMVGAIRHGILSHTLKTLFGLSEDTVTVLCLGTLSYADKYPR
jgi:hypothetical protein